MAFETQNVFQKFVRPAAAEFVGTCLFVFMILCTITTGSSFTALVAGLVIAMVIIVFMDISGGHVNPVVSLAIYLSGGIQLSLMLLYVVSQLLGAIVAAAFTKAVVDEKLWEKYYGGSNTLGRDVGIGRAILVEIITTANLILVILVSAVDKKTKSPIGPLAIGMAVVCGAYAAADVTGGSMNPARSFGPAIVSSTWDDHYVFWVGPILGCLVACGLYNFVFASPDQLFWNKLSNRRSKKKYTEEEAEIPMTDAEHQSIP